MPSGDEPRPPPGVLDGLGRYLGLGMQFALAVGLFVAVGWWTDGKLHTTPLLTILGALVGGGAGFYSLYHHAVVVPRRGERP